MRAKNKPQSHFVLTLEVEDRRAEELAAGLEAEWGLPPIVLQKPNYPRAWLEFYFEHQAAAELGQRVLSRSDGILATHVRKCEPRQWLSFWKHHFKAQDIGAQLRICPVWEKTRARRPGRKTVWVDPGASFGTGDHFTTRFCLEMLDRLCQKAASRSMLDVGTGSGILAIAAAKLGCSRTLGLDHDELALRQARKNVAVNRVSKAVRLRVQDVVVEPVAEQFDIVCANIISGVLVDIAPSLVRAAKRHLILSGIREMEADGVAEAFMRLGPREIVRDGDGEWVGLLFEIGKRR